MPYKLNFANFHPIYTIFSHGFPIDNTLSLSYNGDMKKGSRTQEGAIVSCIGIACNLALAAAKLAVGALFGLVSAIADGFNNLSDCGSGIVSLVSFRVSAKPADREHPYGHRRAEYIAALVTGLFVLFLAVGLLRESIEKIVTKSPSESSWIVFPVLGVSVAVKAGLFLFYRLSAKKLSSDVLRAAAADSLCDCVATSAVIAGLIVLRYTSFPADGWAGILVACFIVWQGAKILREASSELLGQAPDASLVNAIGAEISAHEKILGMHDLHVFSYGKDALYATVHVEMDATMSAMEAHEIIDDIEHEAKNKLGVSLTAHLDPVDLQDGEAHALEESILSEAKNLSEKIALHDFRLVRGKEGAVIFDAVVPFSCTMTDDGLRTALEDIVMSRGDYKPIITVERE